MNSAFLEQIIWSRPWLASVRAVGEAIAQASDWRRELNRRVTELGVRNHRNLPIQFVAQSELPAGLAYEAFISQTGCVPTRDNLHDFFNALVWLTFPRIKVQLNALQAREIERATAENTSKPRGKLRDAATIFDENAILLVTSNHELVTALRTHEWEEVFIRRRSDFVQDCQVFLFGHALMEKLVTPYKAITGHAWVVMLDMPNAELSVEDANVWQWVDVTVACQLAQGLSTADFSPLPVLGVPGWWSDQDQTFYQDVAVFRPRRGM
ncbi:DUF3025 domain-containing protein [Herminiimonas fonticola]|uniref:DUF3025 family protein n=1 Tax=Herminiimonas fonticola TaxID=303380 RepID=A0A4R6G584_9BURK|nr:DUF3025 domain-containing protein [Herminiimonas fonticola]RBA23135.1 Protein of unknown function (DUF3025) [Herminiimonas fonticola]TDN88854.1 DUF3025 family protein [Herminiimonas fonticola]